MHLSKIEYALLVCFWLFEYSVNNLRCICIEKPDQYQYLGNCPPTPPLTQQQSIDNNLGLMLG